MAFFDFGDEEVQLTEAEELLPEEFWEIPETYVGDSRLRDMYEKIYLQLLAENPDRDIIETLLIERAAALYAYMRSIESSGGFNNSNDYRHLMNTWNGMAQDLRKTRKTNFDEVKVRDEVIREYLDIVKDALKGFDVEVANTLLRRIITSLESS